MSQKSASAALDAFLAPRRTALSCVADVTLPAGAAVRVPSSDELLIGTPAEPLVLRGPLDLRLTARWRVRVVAASRHEWDAIETEYAYRLDAADGRGFLAHHWHPMTEAVTFPHLHLGPALGALRREPSRAHLPTGYVALTDVLWLALRDLAVQPLRRDWQTILAAFASIITATR